MSCAPEPPSLRNGPYKTKPVSWFKDVYIYVYDEKSALSLLYRPQLRAIRGMLSTQFFIRRGRERGGGIDGHLIFFFEMHGLKMAI